MNIMEIIATLNEIKARCRELKKQGKTIALVPTMGYLHAGHISLITKAKELADIVVVSRFVNPTQFAPNEDLDAYPNDPDRDHAATEKAGTDILFEPPANAMYHPDHATWVEVPELAKGLCGVTRPTHFRGVCTVVTKLFNLIQPDFACFGEKDYQQLTIIRRMVRDLNMPVEIVGCPLVRESDGLAMSSRNAYLTEEERALAPHIRKGLLLLKEKAEQGEHSAKNLHAFFAGYIKKNIPMARIDYCSMVDKDNLENVETLKGSAVVAVAVYLGKARLLDNISITK